MRGIKHVLSMAILRKGIKRKIIVCPQPIGKAALITHAKD